MPSSIFIEVAMTAGTFALRRPSTWARVEQPLRNTSFKPSLFPKSAANPPA